MTVLTPWCSTNVAITGLFERPFTALLFKNNLRLKSSDCTRQTDGKSVFQRGALWLLGGTSALAFAAFNRLWCKTDSLSRFFESALLLQFKRCLTTKSLPGKQIQSTFYKCHKVQSAILEFPIL